MAGHRAGTAVTPTQAAHAVHAPGPMTITASGAAPCVHRYHDRSQAVAAADIAVRSHCQARKSGGFPLPRVHQVILRCRFRPQCRVGRALNASAGSPPRQHIRHSR